MDMENFRYAPIVAFAYNRADKIIGCLESLEKNPEAGESDLIIYSDGPKSEAGAGKVKETYGIHHSDRYKRIVQRPD